MAETITTLIGFILGILGSWLFWKYLLVLKPSVRISPYILKGENRTDLRQTVYRIKVINFGNRQVIELQANASIVEVQNDTVPILATVRELSLRFNGVLPVLGSKDDYGDVFNQVSPIFHLLILDERNLEEQLTDNHRIKFTLSAKDALSGTTVVQRKLYTKSEIQKGEFVRGLTFEKISD